MTKLPNATRSLALVVAMVASLTTATAAEHGVNKIHVTVNGTVMKATLVDSPTTRDFVSLLPLTIPMRDLFAREKSGDLPRSLSEGGERNRTYEVGEVIYWSPSANLAVFYLHDGPAIPFPGIIVLGKIDSGWRRSTWLGQASHSDDRSNQIIKSGTRS